MTRRKTNDQFGQKLDKREPASLIRGAKAQHSDMERTRQSELPVSRQGMHQESEHNKHNKPPQGAQKH